MQLVEHHAGELGREARIERNRVRFPAQAGVAVEELLEEATDPGHEGEGAAGPRLGELVEGVFDERFVAAAGEDVGGAAGHAEGGGVESRGSGNSNGNGNGQGGGGSRRDRRAAARDAQKKGKKGPRR